MSTYHSHLHNKSYISQALRPIGLSHMVASLSFAYWAIKYRPVFGKNQPSFGLRNTTAFIAYAGTSLYAFSMCFIPKDRSNIKAYGLYVGVYLGTWLMGTKNIYKRYDEQVNIIKKSKLIAGEALEEQQNRLRNTNNNSSSYSTKYSNAGKESENSVPKSGASESLSNPGYPHLNFGNKPYEPDPLNNFIPNTEFGMPSAPEQQDGYNYTPPPVYNENWTGFGPDRIRNDSFGFGDGSTKYQGNNPYQAAQTYYSNIPPHVEKQNNGPKHLIPNRGANYGK